MVSGEGSLSQDFGLTCTLVYLSNIFGEGSFEQTKRVPNLVSFPP